MAPAGGSAIRHHPNLRHPSGSSAPAMVAIITDIVTNKEIGIHRTWLLPDGSGKADLSPNKMMLGKAAGGCVRLVDDDLVEQRLGVCEGLETGLAICRAGWHCWSLLSTSGLRSMPFLRGIDLTVFADADENNAGQSAAQVLAERWSASGGHCEIITPKSIGIDFADLAAECAA
jgi:hypothetical protein